MLKEKLLMCRIIKEKLNLFTFYEFALRTNKEKCSKIIRILYNNHYNFLKKTF